VTTVGTGSDSEAAVNSLMTDRLLVVVAVVVFFVVEE